MRRGRDSRAFFIFCKGKTEKRTVQGLMLMERKNYLLLISQSLFAVIIAVCAFSGVMNTSSMLVDRALAVAEEKAVSITESREPKASVPAKEPKKEKKKDLKAETDLKDGVYYGTGRGYGGNIRVRLTVKGGKINALEIVDHSSETPSFFSRAASVASAIVNAGTADVDGVSGATLSSNGIKAAAADAIKQAGGKGNTSLKAAAKTKGPAKGKTKKKKYSKPKGGWKDGVYTGSAQGYGGTVSVRVTIKKGKIKNISASGNSETASYWNRAQGVKSKIIKNQSPKVDAVSGATYSSNGIINAVIAALNKAEKTIGPKAQTINTGKEEYHITVGKTKDIKAKAKTKLTYKSSDDSIASVNKKGKISAKSAGTVKIKISAKGTSKYKKATKTIKVIVTRKGQTITIPGTKAGSAVVFKESDKGTELQLNAYSTSGKPLTYSSDNEDVAIVNNQGVVLINGKGTARITITAPRTSVYESAAVVLIIKVKSESEDDPEEPVEITGTFTGSAKGYGGPVTCTVVIEDGVIKEITADGPKETWKYWTKAQKIVPKMVSRQTWDVNAVSGATLSSNGIRNAVKQALTEAGLI